MGYENVGWEVIGRISHHNSHQDYLDEVLWAELIAKLVQIAEDPKYSSVVVLNNEAAGASRGELFKENNETS